MELIKFKDKSYPLFQSKGFAAKFAFPFAKEVCKGYGYDIGCCKKEWCFDGAIGIDLTFKNGYDAFHLPEEKVDYIFSSHMVEHVDHWVDCLDYWTTKIKSGGTLFLYLPHPSQEYWLPYNNRKHIHVLYPEMIEKYLKQAPYKNIFVSGVDLNNSYALMAEKI